MVWRMVFSRPRYFFGKVLSADDFTAEQNYLSEKQRLRNRFTLGEGIVSGLSVALGKKGSGQQVVLSPGLAIDHAGNEIFVHEAMACALPSSGKRIYVCLRYVEAETSPVPAIFPDSDSIDNLVQNSRIEEGFDMTFEPTLPTSPGLTLALLLRKRNRWTVSSSFRPRRVKGGSRR
jgi:hypothetical protein